MALPDQPSFTRFGGIPLNKPVRKAVLPVAGLGTRFLPATKCMPKEMLPVVDTPTIQYVVEECVLSGITDILMVIGRSKRAIEEHFNPAPELELELAEPELDSEPNLDEIPKLILRPHIDFWRCQKSISERNAKNDVEATN